MVTPAVDDNAVGADVDAVPPVALVPYQRRLLPVLAVAVNALTAPPSHTDEAVVTGVDGIGFTVICIALDAALTHPFAFVETTV